MNILKEYLAYYRDNPEGYWFKRKLYGWGWTPARWQGWLVLLVWVAFYIFVLTRISHYLVQSFVWIAFSVGVLLYICYTKGEPPRWQWGLPKK